MGTLLPSSLPSTTYQSTYHASLITRRFYCQGRTLLIYTLTTLASAIAGSIAPFQPAFNERKNKVGHAARIPPFDF